MKPPLSFTVTQDEAGATLRELLLRKFSSYTPADITDAAAAGLLLTDGIPASPNAPAALGTKIEYQPPQTPEPDIDDAYSIVYEDDSIALINKSGNLPCHPAGRYYDNTLSRLLIARNGFPAANMVNRLDRETSGLVLVAKTTEAASRCGRDLMADLFSKSYLVIVEGLWALPQDYTARGLIRLERGDVIRKKRVFEETPPESETLSSNAQKCETIFRLLKTSSSDSLSLLEARPITGRPHQIRATLKALGYPVAGDKLYGPDETIYARLCADALTPSDLAALRRLPRQMLHSWRLSLPHPITRATLTFEAPMPNDMNVI